MTDRKPLLKEMDPGAGALGDHAMEGSGRPVGCWRCQGETDLSLKNGRNSIFGVFIRSRRKELGSTAKC